jgi:hypothetical protein
MFYKKGEKLELFGFTDSDYAKDQDDRRSTLGYVFMLGTCVVLWSLRSNKLSPYQLQKLNLLLPQLVLVKLSS